MAFKFSTPSLLRMLPIFLSFLFANFTGLMSEQAINHYVIQYSEAVRIRRIYDKAFI